MPIPQTALVTGAARRIGRHIAEGLARDGVAVAIHCRAPEDGEATASAIRAMGGTAAIVTADLAEADAVDTLVARASAAIGPIGVLVNNASEFEPDELPALDRARYARSMAVDLDTPVFLAQAFARALPADAEGLVVNVIDQRVWKPTPQFFSYSLAKHALWAATRMMAQGLAPRIRVNAVGPGPTLSNHRQTADDFARQAAATLLGRGPELDEFTAAIRFFLAARSVTGQMLALDGGQHLAWQTADVVGVGE